MSWLDGITDSWVWVNSRSWWWTGKTGGLQSMVIVASEMTQRQNTWDTQETDNTSLWPEEKNCAKLIAVYFYKAPQAEFQTAWISLFSIAQVHTCYRTARGVKSLSTAESSQSPFSSPYQKKGMFPCLQGTIKLKAVSRLLGRTPHLQARSARAEKPVCRHISTTLLWLH